MKRVVVQLATVIAMAFSASAADRTWTGGGDGATWGDPDNWGGTAPTAGDSVVISNAVSGTTLSLVNDLGSAESPLLLDNITLGGEGSIRLSGNPVSPSTAHTGTFLSTDCGGDGAITDFDILFPNHATATRVFLKSENLSWWTHNGRISAGGDTSIYLNVPSNNTAEHGQRFYGDISVPNGSVDAVGGVNNARFHFYGRLSVKDFNGNNRSGTSNRGIVAFYNSSNEFVSVGVTQGSISVNAIDALGVGAELVGGYATGSYFDIGSYDQTVGKMSSSATAGFSNSGHYITGTGGTLTIKAEESFSCDFRYRGSVNVVWAPVGDFTYTGTERTHDTSGKITVKRGTMAFGGQTKFSNLAKIEIASGATFSLATATAANPLPSLSELWIGSGTTSKIALPSGCLVSGVKVFVGGVPLAGGETYTGEGGTADHVVPWIDGTGVITAAAVSDRYWSGAADSSWGNTSNWTTEDLPPNGLATYVCTPDAGPVVSGADDYTFNLSGFANNDTTPAFMLDHGAVLSVSGGSLSITNMCGKVRIGGDDSSVTSRVEVSGGSLAMHASRQGSFAIDKGGLLRLTGGETSFETAVSGNAYQWLFRMLGGAVEMSNDAHAVITSSGNPRGLFGTGEVRVGGNARLDLSGNGRSYWTPAEEGMSLLVDIYGNAAVTNGGGLAWISGYYDRTRTSVSVRENATLALPSSYVGRGVTSVSSHGELSVSGSATVTVGGEGLFVANNGSSGNPSSGRVAVSGGVLQISASSAATAPEVHGLAVGYNPYSGGFTNIDNEGVFELSGGTVKNTNNRDSFVVGEGNAKGEFVQTGGTFTQGSKDSYVGWHGGIGWYAFSGDGTADFSSCTIYIGANGGKGTLEIGAGSGTFTSKNLNFAGSDATLKFKLGTDGSLAALNVTGTFTVASGAKLVVDATEYAGSESVTLMTFAANSGTFAAEDIEIVAAKPSKFNVVQNSGSIRFTVPQRGFMLMVK